MVKSMLFVILFLSKYCLAQDIADKKFEQFYQDDILKANGIQVVNFWASWCKPCIVELPYFEKINSEIGSNNFKVCLVNLDFNSKFRGAATDFIKNKKIKSKVVHINDTDPNEWINKVDSSWSGAIPATLIYVNGQKVFFKEGEMSYEELKAEILKAENKQN
ncbi:MAG: TlpA family protein disulfide reductase [Bacteroidetes bacterium]|nr:TlpA family protein disulfide reductase [Bacteroidota bacterium]